MEIIYSYLLIFILGAIWGSFGNVLVDRGEKGKSLFGRSKCDFCGYTLRWYDNIPIISFFLIGGRCRKCKRKLSWQYPLVEAGFGILFVVMAWQAGLSRQSLADGISENFVIELVFLLSIGFLLGAIFLWDLKYMIIPDELVLTGLAISFVYYVYRYLVSSCSLFDYNCHISSNLIGALLVSLFFYLIFWLSKGRWIGGGDVKLGFWLGFLVNWKNVYFFLLFAYILGSIIAVILLARGKKQLKSQVPFGPFLIVSGLLILLFHERIWATWNQLVW